VQRRITTDSNRSLRSLGRAKARPLTKRYAEEVTMEWYSYLAIIAFALIAIIDRIRLKKLCDESSKTVSKNKIEQLEKHINHLETKLKNTEEQLARFENCTAETIKYIKEHWELSNPQQYKGLVDPKRSAILQILKEKYPSEFHYSFINEKVYKLH
jgi:capsule polysaccharide export protein KpsE/RkpR